MPSFDQHCEESVRLFGEPFEEVHKWLDEFAGLPPHGMRHRKFRHHLAGIDEVRKRWGERADEEAAWSACQRAMAGGPNSNWMPAFENWSRISTDLNVRRMELMQRQDWAGFLKTYL